MNIQDFGPIIPDPEDLLSGAFIYGPEAGIPFQPRPQPAFLDRLALAFQSLPMQTPQNDLQGFLQGLAGGFGQARGGAFQRQDLEVQEQNRQLAESARLMSQQRWQKYRAQAELLKGQREAAERQMQAERQRRLDESLIESRKPRTLAEIEAEAAAGERGRTTGRGGRISPEGQTRISDRIADNVRQDRDIQSYVAIRDAYEAGEAAADRKTSAGDIILMRLLAKASDWGSSVREEEFNTFKGAAGVYARLFPKFTSDLIGAGQLTNKGRQVLKAELSGLYTQKLPHYRRAVKFYSDQEKKAGLQAGEAVRDFESPASKKRFTDAGEDLGATPAGMVRMVAPDGRKLLVPAAKAAALEAQGARRR